MPSDRDPVSPTLSFLETLGVERVEPDGLRLTIRGDHLRTLGIAHGGVVATLLDSVMGKHANRSSPPDHYVVTAQLNVHFIRPAFDGETLLATSQVRHAGRKTAVAVGEIHTANGELVAHGSATFVFVAHDERTRAKPDRLDPTS